MAVKLIVDVDIKARATQAEREFKAMAKAVKLTGAEVKNLEQKIPQATAVLKQHEAKLRELGRAHKGASTQYKNLAKHITSQRAYVKNLKNELVRYTTAQKQGTTAGMKLFTTQQKLNRSLRESAVQERKVTTGRKKHTRAVVDQERKQKRLNRTQGHGIRLGKDVLVTLSRWRNRILLITFAIGGLIMAIRESIQETVKQEAAMRGLMSVGGKTGASFGAIQVAAQDLIKDGLMPLGDAATTLKNLMIAGFSLDQAVTLARAFKDVAAFGRQGSMDLGEAVSSASEGIKNNNSILVDNIGLTKNLSIIMKEAGYSIADMAKITTDANIRQAFMNGLLKEAALFTGDAAKMTKTLSGKFALMSATAKKTSQIIGEKLYPLIGKVTDEFIKLNLQMRKLSDNKEVLEFARQFADIMITLVRAFGQFATFLATHTGLIKWGLAILAGNIAMKAAINVGKGLVALLSKLKWMFTGVTRAIMVFVTASRVGAIGGLKGIFAVVSRLHPALFLLAGAFTLILGLIARFTLFTKSAAESLEELTQRRIKELEQEITQLATRENEIDQLITVAEKYDLEAEAIARLVKEKEKLAETSRLVDLERKRMLAHELIRESPVGALGGMVPFGGMFSDYMMKHPEKSYEEWEKIILFHS